LPELLPELPEEDELLPELFESEPMPLELEPSIEPLPELPLEGLEDELLG